MSINGQTLSLRNFIFVILANFGIQYLAFRYLRILDIAPDLTLLFILFLNIYFSEAVGLLAAFGLGLYQDILFRATVGGHSMVYLLVAYVAGKVVSGKMEPALPLTFLFSVYFSLLFSIAYQALSAPAWGIILFWKPAVFSVYNGIWSLPAFYLYRRGLT